MMAHSSDNYEITADITANRPAGEAALTLKAKRKDLLLLNGHAFVCDPEGDLLRVEG